MPRRIPTLTDYAAFVPGVCGPLPSSVRSVVDSNVIRLLERRVPGPRAVVVLLHGAGGHAEALWPVADAVLPSDVDLVAIDLPLYGDTVSSDPGAVVYRDWIDVARDVVESQPTGVPVVLFGASIGGMLALQVAAETPTAAVVVTCLLDVGDAEARAAAARFRWLGRVAPRLLEVAGRVMPRLRMPLTLVARLDRMSRDRRLSQLCAHDPRGGGGSVSLRFLASWFTAPVDLERYDGADITVIHPAHDGWTAPGLTRRVVERLGGRARMVLLPECGHFPIEQPGLSVAAETIAGVIDGAAAKR